MTNKSRGPYLQLAFVSNLHGLRALHLARRYSLLVDEGAVSTAQVCEEELATGAGDLGVVLAATDVIQWDIVRNGSVLYAANRAAHARDDEERSQFHTV